MIKSLCLFLCIGSFAFAYEVPPTTQSYGYKPTISDTQMEECVKIYNEILSIERNYNSNQASRYDRLVNYYNGQCAGKQSRSACEATNRLNKQRGLPTQSCY